MFLCFSLSKVYALSIKTHCSQSAGNLRWTILLGQILRRCDHLLFRGMRVNGMTTNNSRESGEICLCTTEPKQHWLSWVALSGFDNISINIEMSTTLWGHSSAAGLTTVWRGVSVLHHWAHLWQKNLFFLSFGTKNMPHEMQMEQLHCFNEIMFRMSLIKLDVFEWPCTVTTKQANLSSQLFFTSDHFLSTGQLPGCLSSASQCAHSSVSWLGTP